MARSPPLVRVHSHCLTGDVFASTACDCHEMVERSLAAIAEEDRGVFVYLHHTGAVFGIEAFPLSRARSRRFCSLARATGSRTGTATPCAA